MSEELTLDVGQANEFKLACRRNGWTNSDIKKLTEGDMLATLLPVVRNQAKIVSAHIINCDADPFIPEGWKVEDHIKRGQLEWNSANISLYLSKKQQSGAIEGNKLRKELKGMPVLNACVLDYLLAHPELIPEDWKGKLVFFWGTIYRYSVGDLVVRCLRWHGDRWYWDCRWLVLGFVSIFPAAVSASN